MTHERDSAAAANSVTHRTAHLLPFPPSQPHISVTVTSLQVSDRQRRQATVTARHACRRHSPTHKHGHSHKLTRGKKIAPLEGLALPLRGLLALRHWHSLELRFPVLPAAETGKTLEALETKGCMGMWCVCTAVQLLALAPSREHRSSVMNDGCEDERVKGRANPDRLAQANCKGRKDHRRAARRNSWDDESSARRLCSGAVGRGVQAYAAS